MVVNLVNHLKRCHHVSVLIPGDWEQSNLQCRVVDDVAVYSIRLRMPLDRDRPTLGFLGWLMEFPQTLWRLRALMRKEGIDIVHAHVGKDYQMYLRVLRWIGGPPYLITLHRGDVVEYPNLGKISQRMLHFALMGAGRVNAVSRWLARDAERLFPERAPVAHIHNGVELPDPGIYSKPISVPLPVSVPERYMIMVGSFDFYKGHDIAFQAWAELSRVGEGVQLLVVGDGDGRDGYEAEIRRLGCGDSVHLIGQVPRDDVLRLMRGALAMVFPSRSEGFAYALLEAGAVGIPVLCTNIPAFAEIIEHDLNGLLVAPEDPQALATEARRLSGDPELRGRLARRLNQDVKDRFTAETMTRGYERLYAEVTGKTEDFLGGALEEGRDGV